MWTWLSLAAFVYCLFRWYREWSRGEMRRAEQALQQNIDAHRIHREPVGLLINDPDDDVPPVVIKPVPRIAKHLPPDDEFELGCFFEDALQTEMSVGFAESLAEREGLLRLDYLTSLKPEAAKALAKHKGELTLNGLTELLPEVARALAKHKGFLQLNGLTTLTRDTAEALAQSEGLLRLNGLTTLSPEAAEALAKYDGLLVLSGLTTLTPEAVAALRANPAMKLPEPFKQQKAGTASGIAVGQM